MSGFQAIPLISDKHAIRVDPLESQTASAQALPTSIPSRGTGPAGVNQFGSSSVDAVAADGELSPEDITELQTAAEQGDPEAASLLEQLGIPLGIAAGTIGVGIGGYALRQALANRYQGSDTLPDGSSKFVNGMDIPRTPGMYYPGEMPLTVAGEPGPYIRPDPRQIAQEQRRALPAPAAQITDQRSGRYNQPAPQEQKYIPDLNKKGREVDAAYAQKAEQDAALAAKQAEMPQPNATYHDMLSRAVGMRLRDAAKAVRSKR